MKYTIVYIHVTATRWLMLLCCSAFFHLLDSIDTVIVDDSYAVISFPMYACTNVWKNCSSHFNVCRMYDVHS